MTLNVDIVVPTYNSELVLDRCLASLIGQANVSKIIVVDDGSTDATLLIAQDYKKRNEKIKIIQAAHGGPASARNLGLDVAESPIVMFCDSDDYYEPGTVSEAVKCLCENNADIAVLGIIDVVMKRQKTHRSLKSFISNDVYLNSELVLMDSCVLGSVSNKAYRRSIIGDIRFDQRFKYCEDTVFNLQIITCHHPTMAATRKSLYNYCSNPLSLTRSFAWKDPGMNPSDNLALFARENKLPRKVYELVEAKRLGLRAALHEEGVLKEILFDFFRKGTPTHNYFFNSYVSRKEKLYTLAAAIKEAMGGFA